VRDAEDVTRPRGRPGRGSWSPPWAHAFSSSRTGGLHKQYQNEVSTGDEPTVRQRRSERRCDVTMAATTCSLRRRRPAVGREGERRVRVRRSDEARSRWRNVRVIVDLYIQRYGMGLQLSGPFAGRVGLVCCRFLYEPHSGPSL